MPRGSHLSMNQKKNSLKSLSLMNHALAFTSKERMRLTRRDLPSNSHERTIPTSQMDLATRTPRPLGFSDFSQVTIPNRIFTPASSGMLSPRLLHVGAAFLYPPLMGGSTIIFRVIASRASWIMNWFLISFHTSSSEQYQLNTRIDFSLSN